MFVSAFLVSIVAMFCALVRERALTLVNTISDYGVTMGFGLRNCIIPFWGLNFGMLSQNLKFDS